MLILLLLMLGFSFGIFFSNQYSDDIKYNFLKSNSSAEDYEYAWNSTWGSIYNDYGAEVATDSQNYVYLVGSTDTTGSDICDIILSKYSINGQEMWVKTWGGNNDDRGNDIYIDASDNIYIVGFTKSLGDTDGDVVIINFDTMGNEIFNITWGGPEYDYGMHIFEDSLGNYYVSGLTSSFGDVDGDALIIKFNSIFEEQWNVTWGGSDQDIANKAEIGSNNYLYAVGHSDSVASPGSSDVVLLKYDLDGNYQWERTWGTSFAQRGSSLALDSNDNVYITGHTFGHPASSGKGHLLKYDADGNYQWERIWGVNGEYGNYFYRIIIDDKDDLYISGCTKSYGIPNNYDALLLNYDTSGNQNWYKYWAGTEFDATPGLCMDSIGNIYIAGNTETDSAGGYDILLLKYRNTLGLDISIISPISNNLYGTIAPDFNINIDDPDYDFTWYSLDGGSTNVYSNETTGTIDQTEWDKQGNGTVTITFYANNSLGNEGQAEVTVRKDILSPLITINSPSENQVCGVDAPTFDLTILEHEIDSTWYTLDYGNINISFSGSAGTIDQTEWVKKGGGTVPIRFYANDSLGNVDFSEVIVVKDLISPIVSINSPSVNELFGSIPPDFNLTVIESNLESMWFTLDSGATNITFGSLIGTIDQIEWNKQGNGTVTIIFYARDEGGNEGFAEIIVRKDINFPLITINAPITNDIFELQSPQYDISVAEPNIDTMWYTLDNGITTTLFTEFTGTIDQTEWNKFGNGTLTIIFYANDSTGNIGQASVKIHKDVLGPIITINSPQDDDIFGFNVPNYDLSIEEFNLDSIWYSFDYGMTVLPLYTLTGTLDQAEWETKGSGTIPIRFYANDSLGHESFTDVLVVKDLTIALITINSPSAGDVFGHSSPEYDISIFESNLDSYWYTLNGGVTNITITSFTGTIDQSEWDSHGNGSIIIRFYAKDEGGNEGFAEITVWKDINIPLITINNPKTDDFFGLQPPQYDISVVEPNIDTMWYTLDNGITTTSFTEFTGTIDQTEWDKFADGIVTIRFYIRDKGDNEAFSEVSVNKDLIAPVITINEPELGDIFVDYPPIYSITIDETSLYSFWYSLDDGQTNYSISELTGAIGQDAWDSLSDGHVTLRFYAKDEAGNVGQSSITITKRTTPGPIPPGIPGYNLIALIGVTLGVTLILAKRKLKK